MIRDSFFCSRKNGTRGDERAKGIGDVKMSAPVEVAEKGDFADEQEFTLMNIFRYILNTNSRVQRYLLGASTNSSHIHLLQTSFGKCFDCNKLPRLEY